MKMRQVLQQEKRENTIITDEEIKYRAWDKKRKKMYLWEDLHYHSVRGLVIEIPQNAIPLEFTGFTDSYGQEIYKGDIIKSENHYFYVWWNINYDGYVYERRVRDGFHIHRLKSVNKYIVVGDIYKNKKLLKV